jgi:hypothetical protein
VHPSRPGGVVPHMIRFGVDAPIWRMLARYRCTRCGYKAASMQHPSWGRENRGHPFPPFPMPGESR